MYTSVESRKLKLEGGWELKVVYLFNFLKYFNASGHKLLGSNFENPAIFSDKLKPFSFCITVEERKVRDIYQVGGRHVDRENFVLGISYSKYHSILILFSNDTLHCIYMLLYASCSFRWLQIFKRLSPYKIKVKEKQDFISMIKQIVQHQLLFH